MRALNMVDLYSCAGGAAMGYWQAGFRNIVGVDINNQPRYPFTFRQDDVLDLLSKQVDTFKNWADFVHASPPCQGYSQTRYMSGSESPLLISATRDLLDPLGIPYIIENVEGAQWDMKTPVQLCGSAFGLRVRRHRLFESNIPITGIQCDHEWQDMHKPYQIHLSSARGGYRRTGVQPVFGGNQNLGGDSRFLKGVAMGIDWMKEHEINEAIPPAYSRYLGKQVIQWITA